jgi:acetoin utilization deacetylase AcuC-like enzyme
MLEGRLAESEVRRLGFPWSPELVLRSRAAVGGTCAAAERALLDGVGANLAGGTHHAFPDHGEGYCVFNDIAISIRSLQVQGHIERALVVDLDVHQGNGTAAVFADDPRVYTLSIHGEHNPLPQAALHAGRRASRWRRRRGLPGGAGPSPPRVLEAARRTWSTTRQG